MDLAESQQRLKEVSVARHNATIDATTKARLKKEFDMILAHINKLKKP